MRKLKSAKYPVPYKFDSVVLFVLDCVCMRVYVRVCVFRFQTIEPYKQLKWREDFIRTLALFDFHKL